MKSRGRNIIILILALVVGGGFLYYVINQKQEDGVTKLDPLAFAADSINGYATFYLDELKENTFEELQEVPQGLALKLGINQFFNTELNPVNIDQPMLALHLTRDSVNYGMLIGSLHDSLADMQQSGFVMRSALFDHKLITGQHKNLFILIASDSAMNEKSALKICNDYIQSSKRNLILAQHDFIIGKILNQEAIYSAYNLFDSMDVRIDLNQKKMKLNPHLEDVNFNDIFDLNPKYTSCLFGELEKSKQYAHLSVNKNLFIDWINDIEEYQKFIEKVQKGGLTEKDLIEAWNGQFSYQDLGKITVENSFIVYEMDDEFNTIEVEKTTTKEIDAFAISIGFEPDKKEAFIQQLTQQKLLKKEGLHYKFINVFDAQLEGLFIGENLIISNLPKIDPDYHDVENRTHLFFEKFGHQFNIDFRFQDTMVIEY